MAKTKAKEKLILQKGQKVWAFDRDRRVYTDDKGNKTIGPWYRGMFYETYVIGETTQSYIFGSSATSNPDWGDKIRKTELKVGFNIFLSEEDVEKRCWVHENSGKLSDRIRTCYDYDKMKRILSILDEE